MREYKLVWLEPDAVRELRLDLSADGGYQRERSSLEIKRAAAMGGDDIPPILLGERPVGGRYVIDGGLRQAVALELGVGLWACIVKTTREEERTLFLRWNCGRPVSLSEKLRASTAPLAALVRSLAMSHKGKVWFLRHSSPRDNGVMKADLVARVAHIGAVGENVPPGQMMTIVDRSTETFRSPADYRNATAAVLNVLDVFENQTIHSEKAIAVAEATYANGHRRFREAEVRKLRALPWKNALRPGEARLNWSLKALRAMAFRALGLPVPAEKQSKKKAA